MNDPGRRDRVRVVWLVLAVALLLASCAAPIQPVVLPPATGGHVPVIVLPGMTGTELRDTTTGRIVWGNARSFFVPHDGGYAIALPFMHPEDDTIVAGGPILDVRVLGHRKDVYGPLVRFMQRQGYRLGDLRDPRPGEDLFFFAYDWRLDSVVNARRLSEDLERLRRARGDPSLVVHLVAQSGAAHIARYFLKYGGCTLDKAESGRARASETVRIAKLVLLGTSNGGAIRILREMNRGRRYVPLLGRTFAPEIFFTFPSLVQDLPVYTRDLFVDAEGTSLDVDLFDAETWRTHEWSIFAPEARKRVSRRAALFGNERDQMELLRRNLRDARRFHDLLARDSPSFGDTRYYSIQNLLNPTPSRAVLKRSGDRWITLFAGDREVDRDPWLRFRTVAPGDRHATRESQAWLSPQEQAALARETAYVEGGHFEIVLNPALHRTLLEFLEE